MIMVVGVMTGMIGDIIMIMIMTVSGKPDCHGGNKPGTPSLNGSGSIQDSVGGSSS